VIEKITEVVKMNILYKGFSPKTESDLLLCVRNEACPNNPKIYEKGLKGLLLFRCNKNKSHPDYVARDGASSDTLINAMSFFSKYYRGITGNKRMNAFDALNRLDELFDGQEELLHSFDRLADLHHCLANFSPAPYGFNGCCRYDGKGKYTKDNDFPDVYYKRAEKDFPDIYENFLLTNMEKLCLKPIFVDFDSHLENGKAWYPLDFSDENEFKIFVKSVNDAIFAIETRAKMLINS
jgi:hypothetical protein